MEIKNPRRILALGAPESGVLKLLQELTGSAPTPTTSSTAGISHEWRIETKYYAATLPIWVDEIPNTSEWRTEFTKPEAKEVVTVLGAWIYCFRKPINDTDMATIKETMHAIADVIEHACGYGGDQVCLAVAMPQSTTPYLEVGAEEWEGLCMEYGFEYVDFEQKGSEKNEFGERVGVERAKEALEAGEWEGVEGLEFGSDEDSEFGGFDAEEMEMNMELFGMKGALHGDMRDEEGGAEDEAREVEELEVMMRKMVAIKEMGEGMEEAERKRFAAKAVNDLMKDL